MIITAEIGYLDPNTSPESSGTLYLASEHFVTRSSDTLANQYFAGRLDGEVRYALKLSTQFWGGNSTIGIGSLDIINDDGELDDWASYEFRDQSIVIKQHTGGASYNSAVVLVRGTIDKLEVTGEKRLRLVIRDPAEQLQVPITSAVFSGGTDADGVLKPILFGSVKSAKPILVDESSNGYEVSDLEILQIDDIYDQGVSVGLNYTQTTYGFDLDSAPTGKVVADITGAGVNVTTYTLVKKNPPGPVYDGYTSLYNFGILDPTASPDLSAYYWRSQLSRNVADGGKYYVEFKVIIYDHTSASPDNAPDWNLGCGLSTLSGTPPFYGKPNNADEYTLLFADTGVNGGPVDYSFWENGVLDAGPTTSATGWFNDRIGMLVDFDNGQITWTFNGGAFGPTLSIASASPEKSFYPIVAAASKDTGNNNAIQMLQHEDDMNNLPSGYTPWGGADPTADESFEELTAFITDRIAGLTFDSTSVTTVNALTYGSPAAEYTYGFQYTATTTAADILNAALGSIGGYWFVNRTGNIEVGQLLEPATAALEFDDDEILGEISLRPDNAPGLVKGAGARKNWEIMRESEFAAGAGQATRQQFSRRFRDEYRNSTTLPARYAHAAGAPLGDNLLTASGAAEAEADRWASLYQTRRYFWNVDIAATTDKFDDLLDAIGDTVQITSDRFNLDNGKALRLVGVEGAFLSNVIRMTLWGEGAIPLPVAEPTLAENLTAFYQFDDNADIGNDETGTYDLTKAGAGTPGTTADFYRTGGRSLFFPESGSEAFYSRSSPPATFRPRGGTAWTFAIGVYPIDTTSRNIAGIWNETGDQRSWRIRQNGSTGFVFDISADGDATDASASYSGGVSADNWYHIVVTYDGSTIAIRVNNGAEATASHSGGAFNSSAPFYIGGVIGGTSPAANWQQGTIANHRVDFAAFWDRKLTDNNITALYLSGAYRPYDLLTGDVSAYASLSAAESSGDAWNDGEIVKVVANSAQAKPGEWKYFSSLVGQYNYSGLIHRYRFNDADETDSITLDTEAEEGVAPDLWGWDSVDTGAGITYDTNGGRARFTDTGASLALVIDEQPIAAGDEDRFLIVDRLTGTTAFTTAGPFLQVNMASYDAGGNRLLRVELNGSVGATNWNIDQNGDQGTGSAEGTEARYWMYLNNSKFAVWQDGGFTPIASGSTSGTSVADYGAALACNGNSSKTSVMQCGQIVGGRVTTA